MNNWLIEVTDDKLNNIKKLSRKFSKSFPKRSSEFFFNILNKIDGINSKLVVLKVGNDIHGSIIFYKLSGYKFECWSPSYVFVDDDYRNLSIPFLIKSHNTISKNIINVTPNNSMLKIFKALRYKKLSFGTYPKLIFRNFLHFSTDSSIEITSPPAKLKKIIDPVFFHRSDLKWLKIIRRQKTYHLCFKKTKYFNIPINILVYTDVIDQKILKSILTNYNLESLGFSLCLYPITEPASTLIRFHFKKFIAISNFENKEDIYSILGSEITEVL